MKQRLQAAVRKNWWLGILATVAFMLGGHYAVAAGLGLLILIWNLVLLRLISRNRD